VSLILELTLLLIVVLQMAGIVRRSLVQLVQLSFFHTGPFVLGIAVAPPMQSSVAAEGSACAAPKDAYAQLSEINIFFVMILVSSMVAAMVPISKVAEGEDLSGDGRSVMVVRISGVA
jgi:hypothetical protein